MCASTANNVLTDFIRTGRYDKKRPFYLTSSPSMDILVSSNLERLLFLLSGDEQLVAKLMRQLSEDGAYEVPEELKLFQLSEQHRRLVVINVQGLRRKGGSLLPEYSDEEFNEATFTFVKYYVQSRHYDELVEENKKLKYDLDQELEWRHRTDS